MWGRRAIVLVVITTGLVAGCGGSDNEPDVSATETRIVEQTEIAAVRSGSPTTQAFSTVATDSTQTPTEAATETVPITATSERTATPRPTNTAIPTATEVPTYQVGDSVDVTLAGVGDEGLATIPNSKLTLYAFDSPVATEGPQPQEAEWVWASADVEVCYGDAPESGVLTSSSHWVLLYDDNTRIGPSSLGYGTHPQPPFPFGNETAFAGDCFRGWITYAVPPDMQPVAMICDEAEGRPVEWMLPS